MASEHPAREQMDRVLIPSRIVSPEGTRLSGGWTPPVDIYETNDSIFLKVELPGMSPENISIDLQENTLILQGERKPDAEVEKEQYHRTERTYGTFQRSFVLPTTIDPEAVEAHYKDGILEVRLPKAGMARAARQIPISSGSYPP